MTYKIITGDCLTMLKEMESKSVQCCITSPPYWGLRDYGVEGQLGLEKTPEEYVERLADIFWEVKRVLRDDGTLWLNLGDSYGGVKGRGDQARANDVYRNSGTRAKDLVGIPWRVAFALQADGWYLRQDIIWAKPSPMPESVRDRCTKAHEYVFLLSKEKKYYFDHEVIKEPAISKPHKFGWKKTPHEKGIRQIDRSDVIASPDGKRNRRSVWTISTKPYKAAHFATFPPDLVEPCVLAGCPEGGVVLDPFAGSGTVLGVAEKYGRDSIGIELNPEYCKLIEDRVNAISSIRT
jgi:site-specific DNA-methyltransferase (adenine-specific)